MLVKTVKMAMVMTMKTSNSTSYYEDDSIIDRPYILNALNEQQVKTDLMHIMACCSQDRYEKLMQRFDMKPVKYYYTELFTVCYCKSRYDVFYYFACPTKKYQILKKMK